MSKSITSLPDGVWPVLLTPFTESRSIDWKALDQLVDYYVAAGVGGIFSVCLSSEMYQLGEQERLDLARHIVKHVAGRVPVIASAVASTKVADQTRAVIDMAATGVTAVVLLPCLIADEGESDAVWQSRVEEIVRNTGDIPLGFYECPRPYKRAVSAASLRWAGGTGRFFFHKDTCHNLAQMRTKIAACKGTPLKFYNTEMSTLIATLQAGGQGFSSYAANMYPELVQWICLNHVKQPAVAESLQRLVAIAEYAINSKYPASAKVFVRENAGVQMGVLCRGTYEVLSPHDVLPLIDLSAYVKSLSLPVKIVTLPGAAVPSKSA